MQLLNATRATALNRGSAISRYVALGDSFAVRQADSAAAGWTDRVAARLGQSNAAFEYYNCAKAGAATADVVGDQLAAALTLEPDLVTFSCGADEILRDSVLDVGCYAAYLSNALRALRRSLPAATVVTVTYPDVVRLLGLPRAEGAMVGRMLRQLNEATRSIARRHRIQCVDLALDRAITACTGAPAAIWQEHHRLAADAVLETISRTRNWTHSR